jgi:ribonuclease HI
MMRDDEGSVFLTVFWSKALQNTKGGRSMGKFYAVKAGVCPGIYTSWDECKKQVNGYPGAKYKSFTSLADAENYMGIGNSGEKNEGKINDSFKYDYEVYTDGSYDPDSRQYSYAFVFVKDGSVMYEGSGVGDNEEAAVMRNVAGEIRAVEEAVKLAVEIDARIKIYHDYTGVAYWVVPDPKYGKPWKAKSKFTAAYAEAISKHLDRIVFCKVKAHTGVEYNEHVDRLAKEALGLK